MASTTTLSSAELRERVSSRIRSGQLELPVLPDSAARVLAACNDQNCDSRRLADIVQRDPSVAGHVLRISNSAAYAPSEPIVSLPQAVARLGMRTLSDIAIAAALGAKVFSVPGHEAEVRALWLHSAMTGAWGREVARHLRRNVEGAFLTGLLHDVGKPVLLQAAVDLIAGGNAEEGAVELVVEEFHAEVGALLLSGWALPPWMANAIRWHHAPAQAGAETDLAAMIALADALAYWTQYESAEFEARARGHASLAQLGLYEDELEELMGRRSNVEALSRAFA